MPSGRLARRWVERAAEAVGVTQRHDRGNRPERFRRAMDLLGVTGESELAAYLADAGETPSHRATRRAVMAERIDALRDELRSAGRRTVVFIAKNVFFNQQRYALSLRDRGWTAVVVSLCELRGTHHRQHFDAAFQIDPDCLFPRLHELTDVVIHSQGWLNAYHFPVLVEACRADGVRHIAEMMDVQSFFFPDEQAVAAEIVQCWGADGLAHIRLQKCCERYLVEQCAGLVFCGGDVHQKALAPQAADSPRFLNFPSYPLQRYFAAARALAQPAAGESWRLVFAGGIPPYGARHPHALFGDAQLLPVAEALVAQGLQVDVYLNPCMVPASRPQENYPEYYALQERRLGFRFQVGLLPEQLAPHIASYHFGLMLYDFTGSRVGDLHFKAVIPSKLFQYLEAGLPVLVSARLQSVCALVHRYGIGLVIEEGGLADVARRLRACDYARLRSNVLRAREALSMESQISRLEALYEQ